MKYLLLLYTKKWRIEFFEHFLIPELDKNITIEYFDIYQNNFINTKNILKYKILNLEKLYKNFQCLGLFDDAMNILSLVLYELNNTKLKGTNFLSYQISSNKLCARSLLNGCETVTFNKVTSKEETIKNLGKKSIFKPINSSSSFGIKIIENSDVIKNPYYQQEIIDDIILNTCKKIKELKPYFSKSIVGIIEEYIDPKSIKVSVDGFISNKKINHYSISENVYFNNNSEEFDYLITPCQNLSISEKNKCWLLYDKVIEQLINRGLNNQFCDIEMFIIRSNNESVIKIMEINCRTFSNQLPIFSMIYKENSMFSISQKLLFLDEFTISENLNNNGLIGICLYRPTIKNNTNIINKNNITYYKVSDEVSHIYSIGKDLETIYKNCLDFYDNLKSS
jgi:hypothetical protein